MTTSLPRLSIKIQGDKAILTSPPCPEPDHRGPRTVTIEVPVTTGEALEHGAFVPNALRGVDPDTRERFTSGICSDCWTHLFGGAKREFPRST